MAPKGVKRKIPCRVRGGADPNDCDENYDWFTFNELKNKYGGHGAFLIHGNENIPTRIRECVDELEYGVLKKCFAQRKLMAMQRKEKGMQAFAL